MRFVVLLTMLFVAHCLSTSAVAQQRIQSPDTRAAAKAFEAWFYSAPLDCMNTRLRSGRCTQENGLGYAVFVATPDGNDALIMFSYQNDPTGNMVTNGIAHFRRSGTSFDFVRTFGPSLPLHQGLARGTQPQFADGKVVVTLATFGRNDPSCCASGRTRVTLALR